MGTISGVDLNVVIACTPPNFYILLLLPSLSSLVWSISILFWATCQPFCAQINWITPFIISYGQDGLSGEFLWRNSFYNRVLEVHHLQLDFSSDFIMKKSLCKLEVNKISNFVFIELEDLVLDAIKICLDLTRLGCSKYRAKRFAESL